MLGLKLIHGSKKGPSKQPNNSKIIIGKLLKEIMRMKEKESFEFHRNISPNP